MSRQTFLEPFNAKAMSYYEVARTFVPSTKFTQLAGAWNSVLVGPRGGGKTTLFKMLSVEGQEAWTGATAEPYKQTVGYTGVYVPSDIAWGTMLESLIEAGQDETIGVLFSEAAFVTHVLLSVASAMDRYAELNPVLRLEPGVDNTTGKPTQADLERVVATIAKLWKVQPVSLSPTSLVDALRERLLDIKRDARLRAKLKHTGRPNQGYLGIDMLESASQALQAFDAAYRRPDHRWCLLLDEFEVAPMHLQKTVLAAMRASGAHKLLLKVALAPCGPDLLYDQQGNALPSQNNDVQQVQLWYADKTEAIEFCQQVFLSRSSNYSALAGKMPNDVFGTSAYAVVDDSEDVAQLGLFTLTGRNKKQVTEQFQALAQKDPTFREFLHRKQIDLSLELGMQPGDLNGNTLRKVAPLVAFRNAYKGKGDGKKRGVKPFNAAYSGWESIAAISEGNPRWLIGLITRIMSNSDQIHFPVPTPQQTAAVQWNCQRYAEMLQSVANEQFGSIKTSTPIYDVLSKIGDYFHDRLVRATFVEDPPMSFIVDERVSDDVEHALRIAVNHGAIVCYQIAADVGGFRTLRGLRFRLTYLLAPVFKLPMRKSKSVSLSTILEAKPDTPVSLDDPAANLAEKSIQRDLWDN
ncbi:hypothetical protein [Achromobacter agilis]|uniref:Uncharacterized protein n=1 Tax=Achromobacter agilis TaxID=1353888 RepID=A0A446CI96_9BURK|nr:hypothetical protein [Achromobacter agilis]SSW67531.1 hypothetical protein AGI3411_03194 [Achromobacter agilis]